MKIKHSTYWFEKVKVKEKLAIEIVRAVTKYRLRLDRLYRRYGKKES